MTLDTQTLKDGDIVLVKMRIVNRYGDEGMVYCVPTTFDPTIYPDDEIKELIPIDDIISKDNI